MRHKKLTFEKLRQGYDRAKQPVPKKFKSPDPVRYFGNDEKCFWVGRVIEDTSFDGLHQYKVKFYDGSCIYAFEWELQHAVEPDNWR